MRQIKIEIKKNLNYSQMSSQLEIEVGVPHVEIINQMVNI